jgi:hypothetical protein
VPYSIFLVSVDEFLRAKVLPPYRNIVVVLRRLMSETAPDAKEMISYGILAYKRKRIIAVLNPTKKGITFAFSRGAEFEDKFGLLEGVGKVSKNLRFKSINDMNEEAFRYYLKQALEQDSK